MMVYESAMHLSSVSIPCHADISKRKKKKKVLVGISNFLKASFKFKIQNLANYNYCS